jgi:leader peptidase (prepilin peptidase)/N-methyltransferase
MTNLFSLYILVALLGTIFGSFSNVLILRDTKRRSIATGRSECPECKHVLGVFDLIPLFSYLFLRGRCRYCKAAISVQYPIVEAISALLAIFSCWYGLVGEGSAVLAVGIYISLMAFLIVSVIDIRTYTVTWDYCLIAALAGGGGQILSHALSVQNVLLGALVGGGGIVVVIYGWKLLFKQDGMGSGDIWIAAAMGASVGWPKVILGLYAAVLIGAVYGITLILLRKRTLKMEIPFGPFLALGTIIALHWGQQLYAWYILSL